MKRIFLSLFLILAFISESQAQLTRYLVKFKNKGGTPFTINNPIQYLSQRAIDRRTKYNIAIDSTDLPVTPSYINQVKNVPNVTLLNVSKWANAVTIQTTDANAITTINAFPFVQGSIGIGGRFANTGIFINKYKNEEALSTLSTARTEEVLSDYYNYGSTSFNEIHLHNGEFLHNIGLRGQGMQIAMLDNGFNNYTASNFDAFDSINSNNQVLGTWDFVARNSNVSDDGDHGMSCFSTIAANIPGQFVGKAPKANFWLYQTEENGSEYPIEEFNWACGAERADSSGTDIISSSLGYGIQFSGGIPDYPRSFFDGNTTISAQAADLAAKKGILVFIAAGNEGNNTSFHYILTPADADSVVTVGAVDVNGIVGSLSSYGPSADGQIKPDVASIGINARIQTAGGGIGFGNGTSFACPNMAGLGTCLWQGFPEFNNMKIVKAIQKAGSKFSAPDDRIGYGIPDMKAAFSNLLVDFAISSATINACNVTLNWTSKDVDAMKYEIERKAPGETVYTKVGELNPQQGSLLATHTYQFNNTLTSIASGIVSYRIKQIIDTAVATFAAAYIDTASVVSPGCFPTGTNNVDPTTVLLKVQPNPVSAYTATLIVETNYPVTDMPILIYDIEGRLLMKLKRSKATGKVAIDIPAGKLAGGEYIIRVYNKQKLIGSTSMLKL